MTSIRRTFTAVTAVHAFVAALLLVPASPQAATSSAYRDASPPVLEAAAPLPADDGADAVEAFRRRFERQRRPGVALFWNRQLSDRIAQATVQRQTVQGATRETATETGGEGAKRSTRDQSTSQTTEVGTFAVPEEARAGLDERAEMRLRGAFLATLSRGGLRPLDRSMLVRGSAVRAGAAPDVQANEMQALQGRARYLLQVLLVGDAAAPLGMAFGVSVVDVETAATVLSDYIVASRPRSELGRWVAVNGGAGFERAAVPPVTVEEVGQALALAVMSRWGDGW